MTMSRIGDHDGKAVLVVGATSRIGRSIAEAFLRAGANVMIASRNLKRLEQIAAEQEVEKSRCIAARLDVRDPKSVASAIKAVIAAFGRLDVVVNVAAVNFLAEAQHLSHTGLKAVLDVSGLGTFNLCKGAFKYWFREHGGAIINISATLHHGATAKQLHASAGKAAQESITRSLALEWGQYGIRINALAPGPIADTVGMEILVPEAEARIRVGRSTPIGRLGVPSEVADIVLYLASSQATLFHGAIIIADGGAILTGATRTVVAEG
jgi:peroxisomal 2,4-dienoyl-CoA reductase